MDGNNAVLQCRFAGSDFFQIHLITIKPSNQNLNFSNLNRVLDSNVGIFVVVVAIFSGKEYCLIENFPLQN